MHSFVCAYVWKYEHICVLVLEPVPVCGVRRRINHKDEDKSNNRLDNLELLTHWQNVNFGTHNQRISQSLRTWRKIRDRAVFQFTLDGVLVKKWDSMADAHENGFHKSGISDCCNGRKKAYKGYRWEHADSVC